MATSRTSRPRKNFSRTLTSRRCGLSSQRSYRRSPMAVGSGKQSMSAAAYAIEHQMARDLEEKVIARSVLYTSGERDPTGPKEIPFGTLPKGKHVLQGDDPRLKK